MIASLFFLKFNTKRLLAWMFLALLLGVVSVLLYLPAPLGSLQYVRGEMPELFSFFGFIGESNLPTFTLSYLYGFIMPLFFSGFGISTTRRMLSRPMDDGRMAMLITSRHRRFAILLTHFWVQLLGIVLLISAVFIGQLAMVLVFFKEADVLALSRILLGFGAVAILWTAVCILVSQTSVDELRMKRKSRLIAFFMLLFLLLSRLPGWTSYLRYITIWSLFDGFKLASGSGGLHLALIALSASLLFMLASLFAFSRREL
ncbi:MAG: hypothetical protein GXZ04_04510 [Clostridiales bacterium]|nr:hypothetical protein [Clostridiales bacterium]